MVRAAAAARELGAGFTAETIIDRHAFGLSWNSPREKGGVVVGGPLTPKDLRHIDEVAMKGAFAGER